MKKLCIIIFIFIIVLFYLLYNFNPIGGISANPYPKIEIPIYPAAANIVYFSDISAQIKSKSYMVEVDYPATKVIDFYNIELKRLGFTKFNKDVMTTERWIYFQDGTKKGKPFVCQYVEFWIDQEKKIEIILILRYETTSYGNWNNKLLVVCQIMPYIDDNAINEFFKKLDREGIFEDFMELLKKYATDKQNVDFEKAIRENPDNQYLIEYYNLLKEIFRKDEN